MFMTFFKHCPQWRKLLLYLATRKSICTVQQRFASGNCRLQNGQDEGRDAFKSLKNQQIADKSALLYIQWAELESKTGTDHRLSSTAVIAHCAPICAFIAALTITCSENLCKGTHGGRLSHTFCCVLALHYQVTQAQPLA